MATADRNVPRIAVADRELATLALARSRKGGVAWLAAGVLAWILTLQWVLGAHPRSPLAVPDASFVYPLVIGLVAVAATLYGAALLRLPIRGLGWAVAVSLIGVVIGIVALSWRSNLVAVAWIIATAAAGCLCLVAWRELRAAGSAPAPAHWARVRGPVEAAKPDPMNPEASTAATAASTRPRTLDQVPLDQAWNVLGFEDPHNVAWGRLHRDDEVHLVRDGATMVVSTARGGQLLRWPAGEARCLEVLSGPLAGSYRWELGPLTLSLAPTARDA